MVQVGRTCATIADIMLSLSDGLGHCSTRIKHILACNGNRIWGLGHLMGLDVFGTIILIFRRSQFAVIPANVNTIYLTTSQGPRIAGLKPFYNSQLELAKAMFDI